MSGEAEQMTSRRRVLAALRRDDVDYVPCAPFFNPLHETQRAGRRWQFPWGPSVRERLEYCVEELGTDPVVEAPGQEWAPAEGVTSKTWLAGAVIHKLWATPAGDLHASVRYDHIWPHGLDIPFYSDFNIGHFIDPWLACEGDLACLQAILRPPDGAPALEARRLRHDERQRLADRWHLATMATIGSGLTGAMQLCGAEPLCMMVVDDPHLVDGYLELEHRLSLRNIEIAADCGVDIIRRNGFYETCDFYAPGMLEGFLGRRLGEEVSAARQAGVLTGYTVHTGIMPMLEHLRRLDFDCLMHVDTAFRGVDLKALRDSQRPAKSFWLGPSSTYHMWSEDSEVVRGAVREVFEVFGRRGLLLTACPSAHSIMPWENTLAMIEEWKRLRRG